MRLARILLVSAAVLLAGCEKTHVPFDPARATGPGAPPHMSDVYMAGPGPIHDPAGFGRLIRYAVVRDCDSPLRNTQLVHVPLFLEDAGRAAPTDAAVALYESRLHRPILAPDGHAITLGEFNAPAGSATIRCLNDDKTQVALSLTGLIPNGVYTAWIVTFGAPGFDAAFSKLDGLGALGGPDGTHNSFVASSHGEGTLTVTTSPGRLSVKGKLGDCVLENVREFHVVCAYHIDGATNGPHLGPDGTAVEQLGFMFKR